MNTDDVTLDGLLDEQLDHRREELRQRKLGHFAPPTLIWLAAVPEWSYRIASELRFPLGEHESLGRLLGQLDEAGLVEVREVIEPTGEVSVAFWMPASRRGEVGRYLQQKGTMPELVDVVLGLAHRMHEQLASTPVPGMREWVWVAQSYGKDPSGARLISAADALIAAGSTTEALSLVGAAQALGDVLGEPLLSAARRVQWRVDRAYRETFDARSLATYLPRPEVEGELAALVRGEGSWALHLLGDGGVGKTMTIRYLYSGRLAADLHLPPFAVARVDFDHLDPRYPDRRPVELLLALASELAGFTGSRGAESQKRRFDDAAHVLHEQLATPGVAGGDREALDLAVDSFADFLNELRTPVVLVLDTCEELAKLHAPGTTVPAIDRTFELLERVHDRAPQMRALLAGRRWLTPPPDGPQRSGGLALTDRPYLRVLPVAGFDRRQAEDYLEVRDPGQQISTPLREALLERAGGYADGDVNPFDLSCYSDWALSEPQLDPADLRTAPGDPYVEQRILGRLTDTDVRDALPIAVELGRFDQAMVEPSLVRRGIDPTAAFAGLVGQEWVSVVSYDTKGQPRVLEVNEHLRRRIRTLVNSDPARFPLDRHRLGMELADLVLRGAVEHVPVEAVESAVRLLAPDQAGRMWARLEERITAADAWAWAGQMTPRAAAVEVERAGDGPTILAAIRATQAAAALRMPGRPGLLGLWEDVRAAAPRHPDARSAALLEARSVCGLLAAGRHDKDLLDAMANWRSLSRDLPPESLLSALEGLSQAGVSWPGGSALLTDLCEQVTDPRAGASALLSRAADRRAGGDLDGAAADAEAALTSAAEVSPQQLTGSADWLAPARLLDRARLARAHLALVRSERPDSRLISQWRKEAGGHLDDVDSERLVAATVLWELAWGLVDTQVIAALATQERYDGRRQPTTSWHHRTAPLRPVLALALAAGGEVSRAAAALRHRREEAVSYGEDPGTISTCDATLTRISRRARTTQLTSSVHRSAREGDADVRAEAWATLALVRGETPMTPDEAGGVHAWWRTQIGGQARRPWQVDWVPSADASHPPLATPDNVDALEVMVSGGPSTPDGWAAELGRAIRLLADDGLLLLDGTGSTLGTALRADALLEPRLHLPVEHLPPRMVAEAAMAEGELLALRLPLQASALLRQAVERFKAAGDRDGEMRAAALLILTLARAQGAAITADLDLTRDLVFDEQAQVSKDRADGWPLRFRLATSIATGSNPPRIVDSSPELAGVRKANVVVEAAAPPPSPAAVEAVVAAPQRSAPAQPAQQGSLSHPPEAARKSRVRGVIIGLALVAALLLGSLAAFVLAGSDTPSTTPTPTPTSTIGETPTPSDTSTPSRTPTTPVVPPEPTSSNRLPLTLGALAVTAVGVGVVVLASVMRARSRRSASRPTRPTPASVSPKPAEPPEALGPESRRYAQRTVAVTPRSGGLRWFPCSIRPTPDGLVVIGELRPDKQPPPSGDGATPPLTELSPSMFSSQRPYVVVPLVEPAAAAGQSWPWEQWLGAATPSLGGLPPLWVRFVDRADPFTMEWLPRFGSRSWWAGGGRRSVHADVRIEFHGPQSLRPASSEVSSSYRTADVRRVTHWVGTPVPTVAGWRLRVGGALDEASQAVTRSKAAGEKLLGADDLVESPSAVLVLQADPIDGPPEPLRGLRDGLSSLARSVVLAGTAGAVVVVPPLPDALAADVASSIWRFADTSPERYHPAMVLDLLHNVRMTVARAEQPSPGDGDRASLDVLLYL